VAHVKPLQDHDLPEYQDAFAEMLARAGYVPNSFWTLGHRPEILEALRTLVAVVFAGTVDAGLKSLVAVMSSYGAGCRYCQAHQATAALHRGVSAEKVAALADFERSALYTDAERAALRLALASGQQPNGATQEHFDALRAHFDDGQIVELVAVMATFGFLNRWNETMATELEDIPMAVARDHLAGLGWEPGRHRPD
jgi:uncharacterized peroxidase-related enzyme